MTTLYIVRHAQSAANVDHSILRNNTNVGINLTPTGLEQALETAQFLTQNIKASFIENKHFVQNLRPQFKIWNSPYERTRHTAKIIKEHFKKEGILFLEEENIHISERQMGLIDDAQDYPQSHPAEFNHYKLYNAAKHDFFIRPPLGESAFDVCSRLDFFLKNIVEKESQYKHIIVTHGACVRGFIMMACKRTYEDYLNMKNPYNASVTYIENTIHNGMIFIPKEKTV